MSNWQTTAKTIFCEAVEDEVTVMINKDYSARCTGCRKYCQPNDITRQLIKEKSRRLKRTIQCEGENCPRVTGYKAEIVAEETKK